MWPLLLSALLIFISFIVYDFVTSKPTKNSPPGPWRFPLFGSYMQLLLEDKKNTHKVLAKLTERYNSPLIGMYLGDFYFIIANTYDSCKEIVTNPEFQTRPDAFPFRARAFGKRLGLFFDDGQDWLNRKRTSFRVLRDFGLGRRHENFEAALGEEALDLVEILRRESKDGASLPTPAVFQPMMLNSVTQLLTGRRFPPSEYHRFKNFNNNQVKNLRAIDPTGGMITFKPWLRHIFPETIGYNNFMASNNVLSSFANELIQDNEVDYHPDVTRGLIDALRHASRDNPDLTHEQILITCVDLILPSNTQAQVITFALMHLIEHPNIQRGCQAQIDDVVGRSRVPTLNDKESLSMVEATIYETMRMETALPLLVPHFAQEETKFMSYDIPKYTTFLPNAYAAHHDKNVWGDPEVFRPQRFLNEQGKFDQKKDFTIGFGKGKRVCPGETFTRQNLFVALASILQHFNVEQDTPIDWDALHSGPVISAPDNFKIKFIARP